MVHDDRSTASFVRGGNIGRALTEELYQKILMGVQSRGSLKITSAYRTVSENSIVVILGVIPVTFLGRKFQAVYIKT